MAKYKVITGIFKDHEFNGHPVIIAGESCVWDDDSAGRAYSQSNCIELSVGQFYDLAGVRVYDTYHKLNGHIMMIHREYTFESWQVRVLLDNGRIYDILQSEYILTPNE